MLRARVRATLLGALVLSFLPVACQRGAAGHKTGVAPVVTDTARVIALFKDTVAVSVSFVKGRTFDLRVAGQRDSLRATLMKQRDLWRAGRPRDYQFLLRVECFCPGRRGWLLIESRRSQPLRASDTTGKPAALSAWNTFSIDDMFDMLERAADMDGVVHVAFDPRWHFPADVRTVRLPGPDRWTIIEARGLRPLAVLPPR